jgi:hypothetical protein
MPKDLITVTDSSPADLDDLARRINAEHDQVRNFAKAGLQRAIEAGRLLIEAKALVGHGNWLPWLQANCTVTARSAQTYMLVARQFTELDAAKCATVAHLSFRDALNQLSKAAIAVSAAGPEILEEATDLVEQGQSSTLLMASTQIHRRKKDEEVRAVPPTLLPCLHDDDDERRLQVLHNAETRQWAVMYGPNTAGVRLEENLAAMRERTSWRGKTDIDRMKAEVARLDAEAAALKRRIEDGGNGLVQALKDALEEEHGEALAYTTIIMFAASEEAEAQLVTRLSKHDVADALLFREFDGVSLYRINWKGDVGLMSFSDNGPGKMDWESRTAEEFYGRAQWHGIGFEA